MTEGKTAGTMAATCSHRVASGDGVELSAAAARNGAASVRAPQARPSAPTGDEPMTHLTHCIYASAACQPFDGAALRGLLENSRAHNEQAGITGMLLYADGSFFQVIEGPAEAVSALFARIAADPRHEQVTRIIEEPIARRRFADWSMGFPGVCDDLSALPGFNDFFGHGGCLARLDVGRARKLLEAFGAGRWRQRLSDFAPLAA